MEVFNTEMERTLILSGAVCNIDIFDFNFLLHLFDFVIIYSYLLRYHYCV